MVACGDQLPIGAAKIKSLSSRVREGIRATLRRALNDNPILDLEDKDAPAPARHALPMLRCVHLWNSLRHIKTLNEADKKLLSDEVKLNRIREWCSAKLHAQLTAAHTPHGDFDAAELVHATEAVMLIEGGPESLGPQLLLRIEDALRVHQERSAYWRPLKPITQTPRGMVLLPISVEIANSILRIHTWMCESGVAADRADDRLELARRYATWLETRAKRVPRSESDDAALVRGWASDHIDERGVIHTWETSQVVIFLADLVEAVDRQIGVRMREGGLHELVKPSDPIDPPQRREPLLKLCPIPNNSVQISKLRPYEVMYQRYHKPRATDELCESQPDVSMLLYGPPGTGKSSFACQLAGRLKWNMMTITPSDFIAGGVEQVEARAKAIFAMLEHQRRTVVLLDEIDRLILDRDRPDYGEQGDMFQSMTPSMLVKINDLRSRCKDVVFIIGTNYQERIDPALVRRGRIDRACLLAPPDQAQREAILIRRLTKRLARAGVEPLKELNAEIKERDQGETDEPTPLSIQELVVGTLGNDTLREIERVAGTCALMVYKEIDEVAEVAVSRFGTIQTKGHFLAELKSFPTRPLSPPSIRLGIYGGRFDPAFAPHQMPILEFWVMVALEQEGRDCAEKAGQDADSDAPPDRSAQRALLKGLWALTGDWGETKELSSFKPTDHPVDDLSGLIKQLERLQGTGFPTKQVENAFKRYKLVTATGGAN